MRPTVNDIAREAGVSLATVDRVLNARPGVRRKTIEAVNDAIRRLGYVRDVAAANLARSRVYRMVFVLPETDGQFVGMIAAEAARAAALAAAARSEVEVLRYPAEDAHALAALLARLPGQGIDGVALMAPETPVVRDAVRALREAGVTVATLVTDLPDAGRAHFVGIDNVAAGRTAGVLMGRFLGAGPAQVAVVAESMQLRESVERRLGFDAVMLAGFPHVEVLPTVETHGRPERLAEVLTAALAHAPRAGGVYLLGAGQRALTATLARLALPRRPVVIAHDLTPHARAALIGGSMDAVIAQNVGHLVRSALRVLRAHVDRVPIDPGQEQIRIEIVIRENLPPLAAREGEQGPAGPREEG